MRAFRIFAQAFCIGGVLLCAGNLEAQEVAVSNAEGLRQAMANATPGTTIVLEDGQYSPGAVVTSANGTANARIRVRARNVNGVVLHTNGAEEVFVLNHAFWSFENLNIEVDGGGLLAYKLNAGGTDAEILGGRIRLRPGFEHGIKGSGGPNAGPDRALIKGVEFYMTTDERNGTGNCSGIDFVAAHDIVIDGNYCHDLRQEPSEGAPSGLCSCFFTKGNSQRTIFRNNVVGRVVIGMSAGNGGTGGEFVRDGDPTFESRDALFENNVIFDTNDVGIYLNQSTRTKIYNNTIFNSFSYCNDPLPADCEGTYGSSIDVRFNNSDADIQSNILSKPINDRDGGKSTNSFNILLPSPKDVSWFVNVAGEDFTLRPEAPAADNCKLIAQVPRDIKGTMRPLGRGTDCGAIEIAGTSDPLDTEGPLAGPDAADDGCSCNGTRARDTSWLALAALILIAVRKPKGN